jgi:WD40 repeat protein
METKNIKKPTAIAFIDKTAVAVGGENGCAVFNSHSKRFIKQLRFATTASLVANQDIIAMTDYDPNLEIPSHRRLTVFDTKNYKKKWGDRISYAPLALNCKDNTIIASDNDNINIYYYKENSEHIQQNDDSTGHIGVAFYTPASFEYQLEYKILKPLQYININQTDKLRFISDLTDLQKDALSMFNIKNNTAFTFHPTITLLALLLTNNRVIFWNYATRKFIAITDPLSNNIHEEKTKESCTQRLSFSPDGSQLAVALPDLWEIIQTPDIKED